MQSLFCAKYLAGISVGIINLLVTLMTLRPALLARFPKISVSMASGIYWGICQPNFCVYVSIYSSCTLSFFLCSVIKKTALDKLARLSGAVKDHNFVIQYLPFCCLCM